MARSAEFTEDKIIEAGRSMLAAGKRITGFGLRNAVGGGNANRLLEVWETHALQHSESEPELLSELPLEVSEHLGNVINSFTGEFKEQMTRLAVDMNHRAHKASERRVKEMTGVVRRNPRNFRQPSSSPATSASRSMNLPSVWKV